MEVLRIWVRNLETKKEIRHKIIRLRKEMDPLAWQEATKEITEKIIRHPRFLEETDIYCYVNYNGEVGTELLMEEAWKLGKHVWLPKVEGSEMEFYLVESRQKLEPGAYGILEPAGEQKADGKEGLMIMPGVAFDTNRNRVGYGGGYYDRYLESHPQLHTLALAFDMQVLFEVPAEEQDIKPQLLVTETNIYQEG